MIFKVIHKYDEHAAPLGAPPKKKDRLLGPMGPFLHTLNPPPATHVRPIVLCLYSRTF